MKDFIKTRFDANYDRQRYRCGETLSLEERDNARAQVLVYYKKFESLAQSLSNAEMKLRLPNQETPKGRFFSITGVLDAVADENGNKVIYDIKTLTRAAIERFIDFYSDQLNLYAYIWEQITGEKIYALRIIATRLPEEVQYALKNESPKELEESLQKWNPLIEIEVRKEAIDELIKAFRKTVDFIEDGFFSARSYQELHRNDLAESMCVQCNARFSCDSFLEYVRRHSNKETKANWMAIFDDPFGRKEYFSLSDSFKRELSIDIDQEFD